MAKKKQNKWIWLILIAVVIAAIAWFKPVEEPQTMVDVILIDPAGKETRLSDIPTFALIDGEGPYTKMYIEVKSTNQETSEYINLRNRFPSELARNFLWMETVSGYSGTGTCTAGYLGNPTNYPYVEYDIGPGVSVNWWSCAMAGTEIILSDCTGGLTSPTTKKITAVIQGKYKVQPTYQCDNFAECGGNYVYSNGFERAELTFVVKESPSGIPDFDVGIVLHPFAILAHEQWRKSVEEYW